ncbi:UDP-N-acetylmuramoyl-tripeptide--D-alanyl-D-alanine ligase [Gemella sp. GH3]|uniref:UDP-N-acetylmuramoyl-tripeptide--D-alanyl-D- alanine ligase n=1 Tax=unclassified Gemella TaxID=2624949 RepID=UPI0015D01228|nr:MULTISPECIES: UDP-N-acetylmuramoyl-tripeptide--D-alanyl-D-alanine ligase [unclassified Gemella]MBF0713980.1 UDP-N-acetylmuramoyl-tripeptide--D-alanyl-D-alanine ligase [Gemella sp. GH3.1]NYS50932.1 UDP-N-acetylmuramoyl-tripeptide--D-alanyl-D-alanine ligase [Gemella sp. GH3]
MNYSIKEIIDVLNSTDYKIINNDIVTGVAIDSRLVKQGDLFIPFVGENVDGHDYIATAFKNGAVATLSLKKDININNNIIYIEDSYDAVQSLAKHYLKKIDCKTIVITGSNGKTTTKDIISEILSTTYKIHKTKGNLNNELGVPLTILGADNNIDYLILEMGADGFGQLEFLSKLVEPDVAVITNIGESHIEFFKNRLGIAKGKFEITYGLKNNGYFVYNGDEELLLPLVSNATHKNFSCGVTLKNEVILENYYQKDDYNFFKVNIIEEELKTKLKGKHNLLNILYAITIAKQENINDKDIAIALENLEKITAMRLESIPYNKNSLIINDAYNASPTSMKAAIDVIDELGNFKYKTIILGDMFELGKDEQIFHSSIGEYISEHSHNINKVITVGSLSKNINNSINNKNIQTIHFNSNDEVANYLLNNKINNEALLFKASRGMKLENIIDKIKKS